MRETLCSNVRCNAPTTFDHGIMILIIWKIFFVTIAVIRPYCHSHISNIGIITLPDICFLIYHSLRFSLLIIFFWEFYYVQYACLSNCHFLFQMFRQFPCVSSVGPYVVTDSRPTTLSTFLFDLVDNLLSFENVCIANISLTQSLCSVVELRNRFLVY